MKLPVKVVGVTDLHIVPVDNEVSINTERIPCLQLDLKDENKGSQLNLKSLLHPEYSQDILSLCIQHSPPGQAIKYNVIKSELVSNDEDLSVAFVDSSSQKASKGVRRHVSGTKSRDLSDNFFQVDKQSLVIEEKVNAEQISDPNSPSLIDEKAGNEVIIVQQTYFSKKLKTGVENKFCDMTEKQGFEENVELHPIGLYQNVHVASSDKRKLQLHMRCPLNSTKEKLSRRKKSVNKIRSSRTFITAKFSNSDNITAVEMDSCQKDEAASVSEQTSQEANEWNSTGVLKNTEESNTPVKRKTKSSAELSKSSPKTKKGSKYSKVYQCLMCNSTFTCAASRRIHMRLHTGEKPYVCGDCDTAFLDHSAFRRHKRIHSGSKPYTCPECGECFARSFTLTVHQRRHSGEKPYQCQHCGMSFSQSANLKKHIRVHTGDKPYQCDLCPASFAQGHALKCHRTIHKDDKPFMCQECGDIFSRPQYLQKHMKTHDHTKSFLCQYCPATFRMHESLRYHTESHLGNKIYQCEECMMTFQRKDRYKVHKFRTHRNVKYSCDMCEAVYNRSDHLKRHKAKIHPCGV